MIPYLYTDIHTSENGALRRGTQQYVGPALWISVPIFGVAAGVHQARACADVHHVHVTLNEQLNELHRSSAHCSSLFSRQSEMPHK